ncbi:MAG TPA: hypothetical protein VFV52_01190 [Bacilli bacterium]|nr:hypothetical protein [Bacilli bacterium]
MSNLIDFYNYHLENGFFTVNKISALKDSCCVNVEVEVIDFDETKTQISKACKKPLPKSCDGLKFIFDEDTLVFVEMKGIKNVYKFDIADKSREEHEGILDEKIKKFNLPKKVIDSLSCLSDLVSISGIGLNKVQIKFVFLTDIPLVDYNSGVLDVQSEEYIEYTFSYLAYEDVELDTMVQAKMKYIVDNHIPINDSRVLDRPILMSCEQFVEFYG